MQSLWRQNTTLPQFPTLSGNLKTQAIVIGGGLAGILTAYFLEQKKIRTVVLEAEQIGSGQSSKTTAKVTSQHNLRYHRLIQEFGLTQARMYADANQHAIGAYKQLIQEQFIDCDWEELPAFLYSCADSQMLEQEAQAASSLGITASFTQQCELPFPVQGALRFDNQAQFHPLRLLRSLASSLSIYEHTRVLSVDGHRVQTDHGTVEGDCVIFACHYPFINHPGYYFMRMHQERSYVLALKGPKRLRGMYLGIDPDNGWSMRSWNHLLLLGGGGHRTGENREGSRYRQLRQKAREWWPEAQEIAHWSAQDCMTLDGIPYIGRYSASEPDWYVATGFGKWGMTHSMVSALLITDLITGITSPWEGIFSPQRFTVRASASNFIKDGAHTARALGRRFFAAAREEIGELGAGRGGIVESEGEKIGVYKDPQGQIFAVRPVCPHLGCQLEWNPDELSWDCPCHGSRFDYRGELLDGPAQSSLLPPHTSIAISK